MRFHCESLTLPTISPIQIIDVTDKVRDLLSANPVRNGHLILTSSHTTAFVALNERETMLQQDMLDFLSRVAPPGAGYRHDREPVDGRPNAHSHLIGLFMNASEIIPIADGELLLGGWQSIFFIELDGPREERKLRIQIAGEG